ncbi:MAG: flagellar assembly protein FliW [Deltaproteobacteria bacterium]|nr:flagellar assembly protein FliW [Deltaproteobacteria bacterium]
MQNVVNERQDFIHSKGLKKPESNLSDKGAGVGDRDIIKFNSTSFGDIEISKSKIITFAGGLFGFSHIQRFIIMEYEKEIPFMCLHAVDEPDIAFIIMNPLLIKTDYNIVIKESEISDLGNADKKDLVVFVILTIANDKSPQFTANLRAPLIINSITMKGKQVAMEGESFSIRHPLFG